MDDRLTPSRSRVARVALLALAIGAVGGAMLALMAAKVLQQRSAYPRGLMNVMQQQLAEARKAVRLRGCGDAAAALHWSLLASSARPLMADLAPARGPAFIELADVLDRALVADLDSASCTAQIDAVLQACDGCHSQTR